MPDEGPSIMLMSLTRPWKGFMLGGGLCFLQMEPSGKVHTSASSWVKDRRFGAGISVVVLGLILITRWA